MHTAYRLQTNIIAEMTPESVHADPGQAVAASSIQVAAAAQHGGGSQAAEGGCHPLCSMLLSESAAQAAEPRPFLHSNCFHVYHDLIDFMAVYGRPPFTLTVTMSGLNAIKVLVHSLIS